MLRKHQSHKVLMKQTQDQSTLLGDAYVQQLTFSAEMLMVACDIVLVVWVLVQGLDNAAVHDQHNT